MEALFKDANLMEIDVRGLGVDNDFLWEWKQAKEDRKVVPRAKAPKKDAT